MGGKGGVSLQLWGYWPHTTLRVGGRVYCWKPIQILLPSEYRVPSSCIWLTPDYNPFFIIIVEHNTETRVNLKNIHTMTDNSNWSKVVNHNSKSIVTRFQKVGEISCAFTIFDGPSLLVDAFKAEYTEGKAPINVIASHRELEVLLHPKSCRGCFFDWSALKITKCQTLGKFWHLEICRWDLLCNLTLTVIF